MILSANNLEIGYGDRSLVKPLNFEMREGELICLMGANGCGKSTLLRTLSGISNRLTGSIQLFGRELDQYDESELSKKISLVLTDKPPLNQLKVEEVVGLGRYSHLGFWGMMGKPDFQIIDEAIELLGLNDLRLNYFQELSDGQKQKVFIARALAQDTPLILLDEPTTFLDISHRMEILRLLQEISEVKKKAILFTSHDWELVLEMRGQVWLLDHEKVLHQGVIEDLVLRGTFEKTFKTKGFDFDYQRGAFKEKHQFQSKLSIGGDDEKMMQWTARSLEKLGIEPVSSNSSPQLEIKNGIWLYENDKFSSLTSLVNYFKAR